MIHQVTVLTSPCVQSGPPVNNLLRSVGAFITPISLWFMVRKKQTSIHGAYKPSYNVWGPHPVGILKHIDDLLAIDGEPHWEKNGSLK